MPWDIISWIGFGLVLLLCLFAAYIVYMLAMGGKQVPKNTGNLLDRTAWFINGLFMLHAFLRHREKVYRLVELKLVGVRLMPEGAEVPYKADEIVLMPEGALLRHRVLEGGETDVSYTYQVKRPFKFLDQDLMETVGFAEDDDKVT